MSATQPAADGTAAAATAPPSPLPQHPLRSRSRPWRPRSRPAASAWPRPSTSSPTGCSPKTIIQRQTEAAKARFADVATTPEGELRVERLAAVVAVVAVVGGWLVYRRLRRG